jgi:hypothetical protein
MTSIPTLAPIDDCPHTPGDDRAFQESSLFVWHDLKAGVGGFWRLGQEPVVGQLNSCFGVFTSAGERFRSNVTGAPMRPGDRGETHMAWGSALRVDLDTLSIKADFPDLSATLRFRDFFPRYDWFKLLNRPSAPSHHFEAAGQMTGRIVIGGRQIEIDALGYRDRSWGSRSWEGMRGTRWWPSVFGPDLCLFLTSSLHEPDHFGAYGYMIRDGVPQTLTGVDIGATLDSDAISPRAGIGRFKTADGKESTVHHERADGVLLHVRGYSAVESIGIARLGDRVGMSNLEVCTNPLGGNRPPILTLGANSGEGFSRRPS